MFVHCLLHNLCRHYLVLDLCIYESSFVLRACHMFHYILATAPTWPKLRSMFRCNYQKLLLFSQSSKYLNLILWIKSGWSGNWDLLSRNCKAENHGKKETLLLNCKELLWDTTEREKKSFWLFLVIFTSTFDFSSRWIFIKFTWIKPNWKINRCLNESKRRLNMAALHSSYKRADTRAYKIQQVSINQH